MQLCPAADLANHDDVDELAQWAQNSFDYLVSNACFTLKPSLQAPWAGVTIHTAAAIAVYCAAVYCANCSQNVTVPGTHIKSWCDPSAYIHEQ